MEKGIDSLTSGEARARLLELILRVSFEEREVTLASGKKSNFYIDCKQVSLSAEGHFLIGQLSRAAIAARWPEAEAVGGLTIGADPLVSATSLVSFLAGQPLFGFLVRKAPKGHGTGQWIEGLARLRDTMPVVILEDVVTTGASTLRAVERSREANLDVRGVIALVDRQEGGREAVEKQVPLAALFEKADFTD